MSHIMCALMVDNRAFPPITKMQVSKLPETCNLI
jgi:hypothetical protein